jgi:hypothetical protein
MRYSGRSRSITLLAPLIVCQLLWTAAVSIPQVKPYALSFLRSGELAILDAEKGLFLLNPESGRVRTLVQGFGSFEALDMTSAVLADGEALFVTMSLRSSSAGSGPQTQLVRFSVTGQRTGQWILSSSVGRLSGIAVDAQRQVAYDANSQPPMIYRVDLRQSGTPLVWMSGVREARRLGSVVLDERRNRLLVADPYLGRVYAYDLAKRSSEVLLEKLGETAGLALDRATDRLFVADSIGERILVSDLARKAKPVPLPPLQELDEPRGLAFKDSSLWVGDKDEKRVFQLSSTGQLTRLFELKVPPTKAPSGG